MKKSADRGKWLESIIRDWVNTSLENTLQNKANDKAWDDPLVGFSRGDDAYWESFKEHVGPFHWTPAEAFEKAFPDSRVPASKLAVISWVLPQMKKTKWKREKKKSIHPRAGPGEDFTGRS